MVKNDHGFKNARCQTKGRTLFCIKDALPVSLGQNQ